MACSCESLRNFEWKQNRNWIALGLGIFLLFITIVIVRTTMPSPYGSEDGRVAIIGSGVGEEGSQFGGSGGGGTGEDYQVAAVKLHNKLRARHHAPPLTLSADLNAIAIKCAKDYLAGTYYVHDCPERYGYGENISKGSGFYKKTPSEILIMVTNNFYKEVAGYNYDAPSIMHFTQVVWKSSKKLGVGLAFENGEYAAVALYQPSGNTVGRFQENVLPP